MSSLLWGWSGAGEHPDAAGLLAAECAGCRGTVVKHVLNVDFALRWKWSLLTPRCCWAACCWVCRMPRHWRRPSTGTATGRSSFPSKQYRGSGMFIPDPTFFHPETVSIPDPGSASKNLSILTPKNWFLPIPDPGSRVQKGTGSRIRIRNTASKGQCHKQSFVSATFCSLSRWYIRVRLSVFIWSGSGSYPKAKPS